MYVDGKNNTNNNKYYEMIPNEDGTKFTVKYGRVGATPQEYEYELKKWKSKYNAKIRKGYKDITELKAGASVVHEDSGNTDFDKFYEVFSKYTTNFVSKNYLVDKCSKDQIDEAQNIINTITKLKKTNDINDNLLELYKIIPRRMYNVSDYLITDIKQLSGIIQREQNSLDSMDSANITMTTNPFKELNISFKEIDCPKKLRKKIESTNGSRYKIYKCFEVENKSRYDLFNKHVNESTNKTTELLFHGTRNPNIFSILKSDLLIRPSNAISFAGSAYGDGVYHSAHCQKSLGYCGHDNDKIFFIQDVHLGKYYTYNGWYRSGKDISRSKMNYKDMKKMGYDSLYVKAGDGLMNSEYIVYNSIQTVTKYLIWFK